MTAPAISRDAVLRELAAAVLEPAELLAAYAGDRTPAAERSHHGVLTEVPGPGPAGGARVPRGALVR